MVPEFNTLAYRLFTALWVLVLLLAIVGPILGFHYRYTEKPNNSQLLLGSRAGFAVSPRDATLVRFTVGPQASKGRGRPRRPHRRDLRHSVAAHDAVNEEVLADHANDPAYITMGNLLFGTDSPKSR